MMVSPTLAVLPSRPRIAPGPSSTRPRAMSWSAGLCGDGGSLVGGGDDDGGPAVYAVGYQGAGGGGDGVVGGVVADQASMPFVLVQRLPQPRLLQGDASHVRVSRLTRSEARSCAHLPRLRPLETYGSRSSSVSRRQVEREDRGHARQSQVV